ncbi:threonine aldolase family protein [Alkaliphilus transvaalensis]|uniref:threonine aldolase family protein n=1 Tax=Alkaliphilus transvaalensis TaxID=114628 RepID=UPI00047A49FB|nr:low specificity L-threonine aldolase [Alkaliphilus transvaalensis]
MQQENKKVTYSFKNDYSEGAHPNILQALVASNLEQQDGYGEDQYCHAAIETIKEKLQDPNVDIHFVSGGTQANLIVISSILRPYESVIAADTGHISTHETGAIEATGHKVNTIDVKDGKLSPKKIKNLLDLHTDEHMVKPRMVYISNTTEVGTIYKKQELKDLHQFCRENDLLLFLDGARLGSALCSSENDLTLAEIVKLVDVFYIGGTKNGALIGEAIVISNEALKTNFRFNMKQKGALLAKGRLLGIQFLELFKEDLFFQLGNHANQMALKLSENIIELGYQLLTPPQSNQIFPILPNKTIEKLKENYAFYVWSKIDEETSVIRLVTSWATKETAVEAFIEDLKKI